MRDFRVWLVTGRLVGLGAEHDVPNSAQQVSQVRDMQGGVQSHEKVRVLSNYLHPLNSGHVEVRPAQ